MLFNYFFCDNNRLPHKFWSIAFAQCDPSVWALKPNAVSGCQLKSSASQQRATVAQALQPTLRQKQQISEAREVSQAWSTEVCHISWIGCAEENQEHSQRTEQTLTLQLLHVTAALNMSFQHDEQEFDFSYMFEYNQDVQGEAKVGESPSDTYLDYMLCFMQ